MLVSTQVKPTIMKVYELKLDLINDKTTNIKKPLVHLNKDKVLCNHCKRTVSNGIRCLGKCVADNDY